VKRFFQSRAGVTGLVLLGFFVFLGVVGPWLLPRADADRHWHDLAYWQDSPAAAPPSWTASGSAPGLLDAAPAVITEGAGGRLATWLIELPKAPLDGPLVVSLPGEGSLAVLLRSVAPDGTRTEAGRHRVEVSTAAPARLPWSPAGAAALEITVFFPAGSGDPQPPVLLVPGRASGLLGTDASKRDVFTGVVLGVRWALILGLLVSVLTVILGLGLGVLAACWGGWVDALLNRLYEFFSLMPLMPFLIVVSMVYRPTLWTFLVLAVLFFWTRAFKPVYAQALRIRREAFVEAGRTLGAGKVRLALRYVVPALLPYGFAVMALSVPGVILAEAGVSLIGLGDLSTVTWGQMLHDAWTQGAVAGQLWWWFLPPGLMISLMGLTFALIGRGFDKVFSPMPH